MQLVTGLERAAKGHENEWQDHHRQDDVREENDKIYRPKPSGIDKSRHYLGVEVIDQIAGQKHRRGDEGADHTFFVGLLVAFLDKDKTERQKNSRQRV